MTKRFALSLVVFALLSVAACAQQPYTSIRTAVNPGDPSNVTFTFGHLPDGTPGTTELIVECGFARAELLTNFGVYGLTESSGMFPVSCTKTGPKAFVLNGTPETFYLNMIHSNGTTTPLTLVIGSAAWQVVPCKQSRWGCGVGSSQITY